MRTSALLLFLWLAGCEPNRPRGELWSFSASRGTYFGPHAPGPADVNMDRYEALFLDTLPLAIDLVVLPVTGVHDLWIAFR